MTMSPSPLRRFFVPATLLAGSVFCALTVPLALYGQQSVLIKLQQEPIFVGKLKDVAAPYIGLATAISLGSGIASVGLAGWQHTARRSGQLENQLAKLQRDLQAKEYQISQLQLSDEKLAQAGLAAFLEDEIPAAPSKVASEHAAVAVAPKPIDRPPVLQPQPAFAILQDGPDVTATQPTGANFTVQTAVSALPAAQSFVGFTRQPAPAVSGSHSPAPDSDAAPEALTHFDEMQQHLKQLVAQMELLQGKLLQPQTSPEMSASQPPYRQVA